MFEIKNIYTGLAKNQTLLEFKLISESKKTLFKEGILNYSLRTHIKP